MVYIGGYLTKPCPTTISTTSPAFRLVLLNPKRPYVIEFPCPSAGGTVRKLCLTSRTYFILGIHSLSIAFWTYSKHA